MSGSIQSCITPPVSEIEEIRASLRPNSSFQKMLDRYHENQELNIITGELQEPSSEAPAQDETRVRLLKVPSTLQGGGLPGEAKCKRVGDKPAITTRNHEIWEGKWMGSQKVALKLFRINDEGEKSKTKNRLDREVRIWSILRNEYVVPLYGVCTDDGIYPYLVMPWYTNGNATQYLKSKAPADKLKICLDAARGLEYLHTRTRPVVHGNLRGSNILISDDGRALLSDFEFSNIAGAEDSTAISADNHRWMSFEAQQGQRTLDVDVWAWAMTTVELLSGKVPFFTIRVPGLLATMIMEGRHPKKEEYERDGIQIDDGVWSLLESCWEKPDRRVKTKVVLVEMVGLVAGLPDSAGESYEPPTPPRQMESTTIVSSFRPDLHVPDQSSARPTQRSSFSADELHQSLLHRAAFSNDYDTVSKLLSAGADLHARNSAGQTPLHLAVAQSHTETCRLLLQLGADILQPDDNGHGPIFNVAVMRSSDMLEILLESYFDSQPIVSPELEEQIKRILQHVRKASVAIIG
ncbi:hypothetical protein BOTBODRAFT_516704 [Botryobasidium botryosum FD-172 SS1]|uniref:Protein kinase domain-containing protein n=1 Tax=Botryobasidium botryosum (strain FD-172 SS1) TaxID=930990 RepID=A0A067N4A9_BOTB1|nr:hypothetical protein BOTBODRAFT_516704 [Botryobasidium botryosum FD-172 SS1]